MIDKNFCMSSYLAFRYIERDDMDFCEGMHHKNIVLADERQRISVETAEDIGRNLEQIILSVPGKKGLMLSGGMDSAILASYMSGCDAYTFRFLSGKYQKAELERAKIYAKLYGLKLHCVDIDWDIIHLYLDESMKGKGAPVHSIEPQIVAAAIQAKGDGVDVMVIGNLSDYLFGGMDQLLSKDWSFEEFYQRYVFLFPEMVLNFPVSMRYLFERYRRGPDDIDYLGFLKVVPIVESINSYENAFRVADMDYIDPYGALKLRNDLDLKRIRQGESKYLIRELFAMRYPNLSIPDKVPMPRPVDIYFESWEGPKRSEFKKNLSMGEFTGNQKWQLYCLERFLNRFI